MAETFERITSQALVLPQDDIDTDIIFPARFLLITEKGGLGRYAFYEWRFDADGREIDSSPLAAEALAGKAILVAGANFGCGSSREHAPWALRDLGIRAIVAPSFGEIFRSNCFKNGILPVTLAADAVQHLMEDAQSGATLTVDLVEEQVGSSAGFAQSFQTESWRRDALLNGWDEVEVVRNLCGPAIKEYERRQATAMPWLWTRKENIDG